MASRYDNRSYSRGEGQFDRGSESNYGRSSDDQSQRRYRYDDRDDEDERSRRENRSTSDYSNRYGSSNRNYENDREDYGRGSWAGQRDRNYGRYGDESRYDRMSNRYSNERDRNYGDYDDENRYGRASNDYSGQRETYGRYGSENRYGQTSSGYSRYNYPTGFRSGQPYGSSYGQTGRGYGYGNRYGEGYAGERGYEDRYDRGEERGWWDRTSDEISSWFGDQEAERRRQMDRQRAELRGRGPKNYRRSDERIKEDVNDRLGDGYLDATEIEVAVSNAEVTLTGTVQTRSDKRRAEDIAESVSGVSNVENRLRVKQSSLTRNTDLATSSSTGTTGASTGTSTSGSSTSATSTGTTSRGRSAGT
ncbi:MAG TPA: BON domain-containing protein [Pyrinomonadaceae bacterium]|jgi:osmotically-inducible protein OsmY